MYLYAKICCCSCWLCQLWLMMTAILCLNFFFFCCFKFGSHKIFNNFFVIFCGVWIIFKWVWCCVFLWVFTVFFTVLTSDIECKILSVMIMKLMKLSKFLYVIWNGRWFLFLCLSSEIYSMFIIVVCYSLLIIVFHVWDTCVFLFIRSYYLI